MASFKDMLSGLMQSAQSAVSSAKGASGEKNDSPAPSYSFDSANNLYDGSGNVQIAGGYSQYVPTPFRDDLNSQIMGPFKPSDFYFPEWSVGEDIVARDRASQGKRQATKDALEKAAQNGDMGLFRLLSTNGNYAPGDLVNGLITEDVMNQYEQIMQEINEAYPDPESGWERSELKGASADNTAATKPNRLRTDGESVFKPYTQFEDYNRFLETEAGRLFAENHPEYATEDKTGMARLLDSTDVQAIGDLLGINEGYDGSAAMRSRFRNSIPDLYNRETGEWADNWEDLIYNYMWGDDALHLEDLYSGADSLNRLYAEDDEFLPYLGSYLVDNWDLYSELAERAEGVDRKDATMFLVATALNGNNFSDFDADDLSRLLEMTNTPNSIVASGTKGAKEIDPTDPESVRLEGYSVPDLLHVGEEGGLTPGFGTYDKQLLNSLIAYVNANPNNKTKLAYLE